MKFEKKKILDSEILKINLPKLNNISDRELFKFELSRKINEVNIYKIKDLSLSKKGVPLVFHGNIIKDFLKFNSLSKLILFKKIVLYLNYATLFIRNYKKNILKSNIIILHDRHSENYFHWITDVLPKIFWLKEKRFLNSKILLPNFKNTFQKKTLNLITKKYFLNKNNKNLQIKKAYYISEFHPSGVPRLKYLLKTRNFFLKKFNCKYGNQKTYISRKFSERRRLNNEIELIEELRKKNFKILYMENLSFKQQVIESAKSKIIISVHGAGLTNLIWMKKKSKIIEFRDESDINLNPYYVLCQRLKLDYNYFFTQKGIFNKINQHYDYKLNVNDFIKKYESIL